MVQIIRQFEGYILFKVKDYLIDYLDGKFMCNCDGFYYRKKCKHIDECKEYLKNESISNIRN